MHEKIPKQLAGNSLKIACDVLIKHSIHSPRNKPLDPIPFSFCLLKKYLSNRTFLYLFSVTNTIPKTEKITTIKIIKFMPKLNVYKTPTHFIKRF
jgi:hypothetical protein